MSDRILIVRGDITQLEGVDTIVNAANTFLLGGGGVDGAIHRAAGPGLLEECLQFGGCPTGEVRVTTGHDLKARTVIHAVGPVFRDYPRHEAIHLLASCYINALKVTLEVPHAGIKVMAFPCISTGVYGFPIDLAAQVALNCVRKFMSKMGKPETVVLCAFDEQNYTALLEA